MTTSKYSISSLSICASFLSCPTNVQSRIENRHELFAVIVLQTRLRGEFLLNYFSLVSITCFSIQLKWNSIKLCELESFKVFSSTWRKLILKNRWPKKLNWYFYTHLFVIFHSQKDTKWSYTHHWCKEELVKVIKHEREQTVKEAVIYYFQIDENWIWFSLLFFAFFFFLFFSHNVVNVNEKKS